MKTNKGFTLIELLVVIAIIGILSSIVLASLNTARQKGADANIKENLANIRAQAEIIYDGSGCYGDDGVVGSTCVAFAEAQCANGTADSLFANPVVFAQLTSAGTASGGMANTTCSATASGAAWAAAVQLKSDPTDAWCVDSTGASKLYATAAADPDAAAITNSICN